MFFARVRAFEQVTRIGRVHREIVGTTIQRLARRFQTQVSVVAYAQDKSPCPRRTACEKHNRDQQGDERNLHITVISV